MSLSFRVWLAKSPILSLSISILQTKTRPESHQRNQEKPVQRDIKIKTNLDSRNLQSQTTTRSKVRLRPGVKSVNDQDMLRIPTEFHVFIHSLLSPPQLFAPTLPIFGLATATSPADTMDKDALAPLPTATTPGPDTRSSQWIPSPPLINGPKMSRRTPPQVTQSDLALSGSTSGSTFRKLLLPHRTKLKPVLHGPSCSLNT